MNENGNILIIIGVIVLLLIVGGGAYYFGKSQTPKIESQDSAVSQTPSVTQIPSFTSEETANWKLYTNKNFGYSIKYPQDWIIEETSSAISLKSGDYNLSKTGNIVSGQNIVLFVDQNPTKKTIENWWGNTNTDYIISNKISFKTDGRDSIKYNLSAPGSAVYGALISNNDEVFRFEVYSIDSKTSDTITLFTQILSTFKFTN